MEGHRASPHSPCVHLQLYESQVIAQKPELLLPGLQTPAKSVHLLDYNLIYWFCKFNEHTANLFCILDAFD